MQTADVVVIGGGVVGCSVAWHLRRPIDGEAPLRVVVVERDGTYERASSALAMGGVRQQFGSSVNIRLAQYSIDFYRDFDARMSDETFTSRAWFRQRGYLFLANETNAAALSARYERQQARGAQVERLSVEAIRERVPDLVTDDLLFGIFGPDDGYANPREVLAGFRHGAGRAGAQFVEGDVVGVRREHGAVAGVRLGDDRRVDAPVIVNAAGPFAAKVAALAGVDLPVTPSRQHLFRCVLTRAWPYRFPMVVDPSGLHWRHEDPDHVSDRDRVIFAMTNLNEPGGENFDCDASRWETQFAPLLQKRCPSLTFDSVQGWAGLYEMTPDHNPVIEQHPDLRGFYLANGFSGHGLMLAPATGLAISELIRRGRCDTFDLSRFTSRRFASGELFWDEAMI